jgi:ATP-dependent exoDNAse (exonuclease V) alpha subunit
MSARDDLARATEEAKAQVDAARAALTASRDARSGGRAKNAREAERQLQALRGAVVDDIRALRGRLGSLDPSARRGATTAAVVGAGALATLVGSGLAVRGRVRRGIAQRGVQQQAFAIARALAGSALDAPGSPSGRSRRGTLVTLLAVGAAVAGAAALQQRRGAPVDDDDLWLPERGPGPV